MLTAGVLGILFRFPTRSKKAVVGLAPHTKGLLIGIFMGVVELGDLHEMRVGNH